MSFVDGNRDISFTVSVAKHLTGQGLLEDELIDKRIKRILEYSRVIKDMVF